MEIKHSAVAGTLESSDAQVAIEPADTLKVQVISSVEARYGKQIRETASSTQSLSRRARRSMLRMRWSA